jgi:hypothetical protein
MRRPTDPKVKVDGTPLTRGYISLQAETAPADFRKVELLILGGMRDRRRATTRRMSSGRLRRRAVLSEAIVSAVFRLPRLRAHRAPAGLRAATQHARGPAVRESAS